MRLGMRRTMRNSARASSLVTSRKGLSPISSTTAANLKSCTSALLGPHLPVRRFSAQYSATTSESSFAEGCRITLARPEVLLERSILAGSRLASRTHGSPVQHGLVAPTALGAIERIVRRLDRLVGFNAGPRDAHTTANAQCHPH